MKTSVCNKCKYYKTCGGATCGAPCNGYKAITRADILTAIQETRANIETLKNTKKEIKNNWSALFDKYKKAARDNGPEAARIGKKMEALRNDENAAAETIRDLELKIKILNNNYRIALFDETTPKIIAVLEKYNNKPYGPKTREKIRDEIKNACGVYFYINVRSWCDEIIISDEYLRYGAQLEIETRRDENGEIIRLLIDNKINAPEADAQTMYYDTFIDDPNERAQDLKKAYSAARDAQRELEKKCREYNDLTVFGMETLYAEKHIY